MARKTPQINIDVASVVNRDAKRQSKTAAALNLSEPAPAAADPKPAPQEKATTRSRHNYNPAEDPFTMQEINIRIPGDTLHKLQRIADLEGLPLSAYMRSVIMAATDPETDPELAEIIRRIELDRPRNVAVLKTRLSRYKAGPMGTKNVRIPLETREKLQELITRKKLTQSLYLRYIFTELAEREAPAE